MTQRPSLDAIFAAPAAAGQRPPLDAIFGQAGSGQQVQAAYEQSLQAANQDKGFFRNLAEGVGRGAESRVLGVIQAASDLLPDGVVSPGFRQDMAAVARQLQAEGRGTGAGGVVGEIAGDPLTAATLPLAAAGSFGQLALQGARLGAAGGLAQPNTETGPEASRQQRLQDALLGGAAGAAVPAVFKGGEKLAQPLKPLAGEAARLAEKAREIGLKLTPAQATGSKALRGVENAFAELPFTAGKAAEQAAGQSAKFNRAVLAKAGIDADAATPEVLEAAARQFDDAFRSLTAATTVKVDDALLDQLGQVEKEAARRLGPDAGRGVTSVIEDVLNSGGVIDGATYQNTRSILGQMAKGTTDSFQAGLLKQTQRALDAAAERSLPNAAAKAAWKTTRKRYEAYKTIQKAMSSTGAEALAGNIPPAALAMAAKAGKKGYAQGRGELNDLARVGAAFLRDPVGNSGTAQRALYQNMLRGQGTAIASGLVGTGAAAGYQQDGTVGALGGAGLALALPKLLQTAYGRKMVQDYLSGQAGGKVAAAMLPAAKAATAAAVTAANRPDEGSPATITPQNQLPPVNLPQVRQPQAQAPQDTLLDRMAQAESSGDPAAANPNSSATGLFQFTDPTWREMVLRYGKQTGIGLADKASPAAQRTMAALYAQQNLKQLQQSLDRTPTKGELYMAHVLGATGAKQLIRAARSDVPAAKLFSPRVVTANTPLFYRDGKPLRAKDMYQLLDSKVS